MSATADPLTWTCVRCAVTTRWVQAGHLEMPTGWAEEAGSLHCLGCRRVIAGEAAAEGPEAAAGTREHRLKLRKVATLEFEIRRKPDQRDSAIARACHTSVPAVAKVRSRLAESGA